jgi:hypothetical protein
MRKRSTIRVSVRFKARTALFCSARQFATQQCEPVRFSARAVFLLDEAVRDATMRTGAFQRTRRFFARRGRSRRNNANRCVSKHAPVKGCGILLLLWGPGVEPGAGVPHAPPFMVFSMLMVGCLSTRQGMLTNLLLLVALTALAPPQAPLLLDLRSCCR